MQRPGTDAALQEGVTKLSLAGITVVKVTEWPVERFQSVGHTGVNHASHRVVPEILLKERAGLFI